MRNTKKTDSLLGISGKEETVALKMIKTKVLKPKKYKIQ